MHTCDFQRNFAIDLGGGRFYPAFRSSEPELELYPELGIAFVLGARSAGSPGPVSGAQGSAHSPKWRRHGGNPQQVTLAWSPAKAPVVSPIQGRPPGTRRPQ
jgi:hypothetical protein